MASIERKQPFYSPMAQQRNPLIKTSAEIVNEARRSLHVQATQRPFTPVNATRELFGNSNGCAKSRPPSTFSLHAHHFDAPGSRPVSAVRLSRLEHKPAPPVLGSGEEQSRVIPRPPAEPRRARERWAGPRPRLRRPGSLTLLPVERHAIVVEGVNLGQAQRRPSAGPLRTDRSQPSGAQGPRPRRAASEGRAMRLSGGSEDGGTECRPGPGTEVWERHRRAGASEDARSWLWNEAVAPLLLTLESVAAGSAEASVDRLCDLCDRLHGALDEADLLGRSCAGRSGILGTLFRLIDLDSARLQLRIAELCLALEVSGNNLLNICKLIFQISRSESNDIFFQKNSIVERFLSILPNEDVSTSGEALLYCVGALKFLSGNGTMVPLLLHGSCVAASQKLIQRLCTAENRSATMTGLVLVQLTAALRNLSDHADARPLFISSGMFSDLCLVLRLCSHHQDVCTNISRICSKLSSYSECRQALADTPDCFPLFVEVMSKHWQKQDLVVRFLFTLGNLTADAEDARRRLFECEGGVGALLRLYKRYQRRGKEDEDVLVKLVRVLANMCTHPAVGPALAASEACVELLLETLALRSVQESEELLVNVAATINNLSFYQAESSALGRSGLAAVQLMMKLLLSTSMDAVLEAARVLGNLSRSEDVRSVIVQNKAHRIVVALLDSKSCEMCYSACGVLTNLALDPPTRAELSQEEAAAKLVDCLKDLGAGDWQLAGQACQALWNLLSSGPEEVLDEQERESLLQILTTFLDQEAVLGWVEHGDRRDFHMANWEVDFLPVAQKLVTFLQPPDQT